jgi:hypothetical protein
MRKARSIEAFLVAASNPTKQVIDEPPTVRITGHCPDRGTIGRSGANRDYRMSTRNNAHQAHSKSPKAVTEMRPL